MRFGLVKRRAGCLIGLSLLAAVVFASVSFVGSRRTQEAMNRELVVDISRGDVKSALELLERGADPNAPLAAPKPRSFWQILRSAFYRQLPAAAGGTALHLAVAGEHSEEADAPRVVRALFAKGAVTKRRDSLGRTVLLMAVLFAHPGSVQALLDSGVNVNEKSFNGMTALDAMRFKAAFVADEKAVINHPTAVLLRRAGAK